MDDNAVAIVAARRSVIGRFNGSLKNLSASQMGAAVLQQCLKDVRIETASKQAANYNKPAGGGASSSASSETVTAPGAGASSASGSSSNTLPASLIEEVIVGQVLTTGTGQNPARQTCLMAGLPETTPSLTINKVCGSGLKSVHLGMLQVMANSAAEPSAAPGANSTASLIACGGQESMSNAPHFLAGKSSRLGQKMGDMKLQDSMLVDGLTCAFNKYHMGITAENIASKYGISRKDQDEFALSSQKKVGLPTPWRFYLDFQPNCRPRHFYPGFRYGCKAWHSTLICSQNAGRGISTWIPGKDAGSGLSALIFSQ